MRLSPEETLARLAELGPNTMDNVSEAYDLVFAPWVKAQGLIVLEVEIGRVKARLPQDPEQQFFTGAMCGQALMSAVDTVMSLAMHTHGRNSRGTASQNNQFLRAAIGDDLIIEAQVMKMGKNSAYGDTRVWFEGSGDLVVHSTSEFAF